MSQAKERQKVEATFTNQLTAFPLWKLKQRNLNRLLFKGMTGRPTEAFSFGPGDTFNKTDIFIKTFSLLVK